MTGRQGYGYDPPPPPPAPLYPALIRLPASQPGLVSHHSTPVLGHLNGWGYRLINCTLRSPSQLCHTEVDTWCGSSYTLVTGIIDQIHVTFRIPQPVGVLQVRAKAVAHIYVDTTYPGRVTVDPGNLTHPRHHSVTSLRGAQIARRPEQVPWSKWPNRNDPSPRPHPLHRIRAGLWSETFVRLS